MKKQFKILSILLIFLLAVFIFNFVKQQNEKQKISVITYNAQCFFDSVYTGFEFSEFSAKSKFWNEERYIERLKNLASLLTKHRADIVFLQEIENEQIIKDLFNFLPLYTPYKFACFSKEENSAFGCAVLSKFPIKNMQTHQFCFFQNGKITQISMRPLLEIKIKHPKLELTLFALHWKSKKGDNIENDFLRLGQEYILARQIEKLNALIERENTEKIPCILIAGDFNRSVEEFKPSKTKNCVLLNYKKAQIELFSPWLIFENDYVNKGSYCYRGEWSKIDNIFLANLDYKNCRVPVFSSFYVIEDEELLDKNGVPKRYFAYKGDGFSDHLPLFAEISF